MKTDIQFLRELKDDLMQAAESRTPERMATAQTVRHPARPWRAAAAVAAGVLALSGIVGYVATRSSQGVGGGGAVNTTGGGEVRAGSSPAPADRALASLHAPEQAPARGGSAPSLGPSVIKTARVFLRIPKDSFKARFDQATRIAETYDGYVQSSSTAGTRLRSGGMVLRIPASNFERALTDLRALGRVEHQSVEGRDVSAQFVDLAARLRNARAEEQVLLDLLRKAPTVEASLRVQGQLSNTELQIEELEGQIRFLQHRAALSTIDVELSERSPRHHEAPPTHQSFGTAWRNAVDGFFGVATTVVVGLGYVVPVTLLIAMAWLVFRRVRARVVA